MQARAVDLVKVAPASAAQQRSLQAARPNADAGPQPRSRFDAELSRHTRSARGADKPEPSRPEPTGKAKPRRDTDTKPADDAPPADTTAVTDAVDAEDAAVESDESPKAEKTKTKSTKKADAKKGDADETDASDDSTAAAESGSTITLPTADTTAVECDDLAIDADAAKEGVEADADATVDPDAAAAAQLVAQQAAPTQSDVTPTETDATATVPTTAVKGATTAPQTTTAKPAGAEDVEAGEHHAHGPKATGEKLADLDTTADAEAVGAFRLPPEVEKSAGPATGHKDEAAALAALQPTAPHDKPAVPAPLSPTAAPQQPSPVRDPAEHNVDKIVTSVRGELLTKGGTMDIRLDPPTLGQVQLQITVEDGVLSANIQTTNDEATRLLSHNLAQLKSQLESAGVSVDRIQVKQAAPAEQSNSSNGQNADGDARQQSAASQDQSARQEQQRREALQRMWARVAGNGDPLDLVA